MLVANIFKQLSRLMAVLGLTLLALPTASAWSIFGQPQNKQECTLQNLKGVDNETVAQIIVLACEKLFPIKNNATACVQRELMPWERYQLQWTQGEITQLPSGPYFEAKFYNGTKDASIAAVTIKIYVKQPEQPNGDKNAFTFEQAQKPQDKIIVEPKVYKLEDFIPLDFAPQEYEMWLDGPIAPKEIGKITKTILKTPPKDWAWEISSVKVCQ